MLSEVSANGGSTGARATALQHSLSKGECYTALVLARNILTPLNRLSKELQSTSCTVTKSLELVRVTQEHLQAQRDDANTLTRSAIEQAKLIFRVEEVAMPRKKRPPARKTGPAEPHHPSSPEEYIRVEYIKALDAANSQLCSRFQKQDNQHVAQLESLLLSPPDRTRTIATIKSSPWAGDLDEEKLHDDLLAFRRLGEYSTLDEAVALAERWKASSSLFSEVMTLLRLLVTVPASSAASERSFSALRRLKTWLRGTMGQRRLNAVAVCHVHQAATRKVPDVNIAREYAVLNPGRRSTFGAF
ncbi:Zinc finger MYM-type protein 1 [Amphibalanus amphitrite]|uniref:Zinc finger MYM-type protein 1 n=1 Tax=Amphibalanus amphitrite TaxID=1232801 RepID=A0A6A4W1L6_AMPAM|nr:Zinc finger MYM-type protein 1 [Amphibalanus amphitrite]